MTHLQKIICDGCNEVIKKSQGSIGWFFNLSIIEHTEYSENFINAVYKEPPLISSKQFHSKECMKKWMEEKQE